jgi:flagellar biosynthesis/type III secretory pathway M-ring protein FliF/YscJ
MDEQGRTVLRRFLAGLLLVVIIFALIWFIFLRDSGKKEAGNQRDNGNKSQTTSNESDSDNRAQAKSSQDDQQSGSGDQSNTNAKKDSDTRQLSNVGPGNSLAVFISSSVAAGASHYLYRRRRRARS